MTRVTITTTSRELVRAAGWATFCPWEGDSNNILRDFGEGDYSRKRPRGPRRERRRRKKRALLASVMLTPPPQTLWRYLLLLLKKRKVTTSVLLFLPHRFFLELWMWLKACFMPLWITPLRAWSNFFHSGSFKNVFRSLGTWVVDTTVFPTTTRNQTQVSGSITAFSVAIYWVTNLRKVCECTLLD